MNYTHTWTLMRGQPMHNWELSNTGQSKHEALERSKTLRWLLVYTSYNSGPTTGIHKYGSPEVLEHEEAEMRSITLLTCVSSLYHTLTHTHTMCNTSTLTLIFSASLLIHYVQMGCLALERKGSRVRRDVPWLTVVINFMQWIPEWRSS